MPFPTDLSVFIDGAIWTFAKTMPTWPHEYIVRHRVDDRLFEAVVRYIREFGYQGSFYSRPISYFDDQGLVYWTMGEPIEETTIVNRCRKVDSYEARAAAGTLPNR